MLWSLPEEVFSKYPTEREQKELWAVAKLAEHISPRAIVGCNETQASDVDVYLRLDAGQPIPFQVVRAHHQNKNTKNEITKAQPSYKKDEFTFTEIPDNYLSRCTWADAVLNAYKTKIGKYANPADVNLLIYDDTQMWVFVDKGDDYFLELKTRFLQIVPPFKSVLVVTGNRVCVLKGLSQEEISLQTDII